MALIDVSIYRLEDGGFTGRRYSGPAQFLRLAPGEAAIEGGHDPTRMRVDLDTGRVVDFGSPGHQPGAEMPSLEAWEIVRRHRNQLLTASDVAVIRAFETQRPVPSEWVAYRQALRDVPLQADPAKIAWPPPPDSD